MDYKKEIQKLLFELKNLNIERHEIEKELGVSDNYIDQEALWIFMEKWQERELDQDSYAKYKRYIGRLIEWLIANGLQGHYIDEITQDHIETFLLDNRRKNELSNRESNNTFSFVRTAFNFLFKKKIILQNPCDGIDKLKAPSKKHRYYDTKALEDITKALMVRDPCTYFAFQAVYYLCIRSDEEIKNLKVSGIMWEQNKIFVEFGKGKSQRYIPLDEHMKKLLMEQKIFNYPGDYYIFGIKGKPSAEGIGNGFFAKRFRKVRDAAGMNPDYTIYGAKHTRVVHLKSDGVSDADIMSLTGHKDFTAYAKYLRDLGMTADVKNINNKSRKV
jgi:integrase